MLARLSILFLVSILAAQTYKDHARLDYLLDSAGRERPIRNPADWAVRRKHILNAMQQVMGPLPNSARKVPLDMLVAEETHRSGYTIRRITFAVERGDRLPAYLLIPHQRKGRVPAVLSLHQTTAAGKAEPAGITGNEKLKYAAELAQRGFVTLAPDYPNFGDYKIDPYSLGYRSATMKGIWNHMRAIDLLQSLPQVDPNRIGSIGHSLGGHNTLFLAAFDPRIKAAVTNCGFTSFPKYYGGNLTGWSHKGYMPAIESDYGKDPSRMPFDFPEVLAAIAPRAVLAIAPLRDSNFEVSGVRDCVASAAHVYRLLGAESALHALYPDCAHEFPDDLRKQAYDWLKAKLQQRPQATPSVRSWDQ
jgi:dienelactone hydrolase